MRALCVCSIPIARRVFVGVVGADIGGLFHDVRDVGFQGDVRPFGLGLGLGVGGSLLVDGLGRHRLLDDVGVVRFSFGPRLCGCHGDSFR
jgi:hypothetical protein